MTYVKPRVDGKMDFPDAEFDLIMSSAALHHVANVSTVVSEFARCLKPGGYVLIREPVVTQGDWRKPRRGLTTCERGIPLPVFDKMIASAGLEVVRRIRYDFPLTKRLRPLLGKPVFNSRFAVSVDAFFSRLFSWRLHYHPANAWQKIQPASIGYILRRPAA
jgi:SAM-dependent methyltransferase